MKYLLSILIAHAFFSCVKDPHTTYVLKNETKYNIKITGYAHRGVEGNRFIVAAEPITSIPFLK